MTNHMTITENIVEAAEDSIRDKAASIINAVHSRRAHPSFGYTKTEIRKYLDQMDGMIYLYGVLTGQALNPIPGRVAFTDPNTTERVATARAAVKTL